MRQWARGFNFGTMTPRLQTVSVGVALVAALSSSPAPASAIRVDLADTGAIAQALPGVGAALVEAVSGFYVERGHPGYWIDDAGRPRPVAWELLNVLADAGRDGLDPEDYEVDALGERLHRAERLGDGDVLLEVRLTAMMLKFASHLYGGRVPPKRAGWRSEPPKLDLKQLAHEVAAGAGVAETLSQLAPDEPHYLRLREKLQELQSVEARPFPEVPPGKLLSPGESDPRVQLVRERLWAEGYEARTPPEGPDFFDDGLAKAVRGFQIDHGLEADALIGRQMVRAMRHTREDHLRQIRWNMERLRWVPRDRGERQVLVNAAGFYAEVREGSETIWVRPVVVGQVDWDTPMFSDRIEGVELYPDWVVPPKIAREEIAPKMHEDPQWARRNQITVIDRSTRRAVDPQDVDWWLESVDAYQFIQRPGPLNPLGEAKLLMPNRFSVYLHGTKDPEIFQQRQRILSHGCIRVKDVMELTRWLFEQEGRGEELEAAVEAGEHTALELEQPVHVDIVYLTAWVDDEGRLQTRPDVYGRDRALCRALDDCP